MNEQEKETKGSIIDTAELRFEKNLAAEVSHIRVDLTDIERRLDMRLTNEISRLREEMVRGDSLLCEEIQKSKTV